MNRRLVLNLAAFLAVTGVLIGYGMFSLLGNPLAKERIISGVFPDASGLRPDFSVSMDGVVVGIVRSVELVDGGVRVEVALNDGVRVPSDVEASIVRASPVGEQRVELTPTGGGGGDPLEHGDEFIVAESPNPPNISRVIDALARLINDIPPEHLDTFVREAALALEGRGEDLRSLVESSDKFARAFLANEAAFRQLLASGPPVLDSVSAAGPELQAALADTAILVAVLAERRADIVDLMRHAGDLGTVGGDITATQRANLGCLISDFADLNTFLASSEPLANLVEGLQINQEFFGPIDKLAPYGPAKDVGLGAPDRDDQYWLRVHLILPQAQPPGEQYPVVRATPATRPGAACETPYGRGVGPASQPDPAAPTSGGSIEPPGSQPATPGPDLATAQNVAHRPDASGSASMAVAGVGLLLLSERMTIGLLRRRRKRGW